MRSGTILVIAPTFPCSVVPSFPVWLCFEKRELNFCNGYLSLLYFCLYLKEGFISISGDDRTTMESKFPLNPNIPTRVVTTPSMKNVIILPAPMTVKEEKGSIKNQNSWHSDTKQGTSRQARQNRIEQDKRKAEKSFLLLFNNGIFDF